MLKKHSLFQLRARGVFAGACVAAMAGCGEQQQPTGASAASPVVSSVVLPEPDSAAAKVYVKKCGECHAPPAPTSHTVAEWPPIVHRMQYRRIAKGKGALTEPEFKVILEYLTTHARS